MESEKIDKRERIRCLECGYEGLAGVPQKEVLPLPLLIRIVLFVVFVFVYIFNLFFANGEMNFSDFSDGIWNSSRKNNLCPQCKAVHLEKIS